MKRVLREELWNTTFHSLATKQIHRSDDRTRGEWCFIWAGYFFGLSQERELKKWLLQVGFSLFMLTLWVLWSRFEVSGNLIYQQLDLLTQRISFLLLRWVQEERNDRGEGDSFQQMPRISEEPSCDSAVFGGSSWRGMRDSLVIFKRQLLCYWPAQVHREGVRGWRSKWKQGRRQTKEPNSSWNLGLFLNVS